MEPRRPNGKGPPWSRTTASLSLYCWQAFGPLLVASEGQYHGKPVGSPPRGLGLYQPLRQVQKERKKERERERERERQREREREKERDRQRATRKGERRGEIVERVE